MTSINKTIFAVIILIIVSASCFLLLENINIEARSVFAKFLIEGYLTLILFILLHILFIIKGIISLIEKKWLKGFFFVFIPLILSPFSGFAFVLAIRDINIFNQDYVIYTNNLDKIIIQYYETGITGNPNNRIILTSDDLTNSYRKFEIIHQYQIDTKYIDKNSDIRLGCKTFPEKIIYNNRTFKLFQCDE